MKDLNIEIGRVVVSKAGRDKGKRMVVVSIGKDGCVFVTDGDKRKLDNPKRIQLQGDSQPIN